MYISFDLAENKISRAGTKAIISGDFSFLEEVLMGIVSSIQIIAGWMMQLQSNLRRDDGRSSLESVYETMLLLIMVLSIWERGIGVDFDRLA